MKSKIQTLTFITLIFIILLIITPISLAKPRKTYLTDFILSTQINDQDGFSNSVKVDEFISIEATAYALEMIDFYNLPEQSPIFPTDLFPYQHFNKTAIVANITNRFNEWVNQSDINVYELYFYLKSFSSLNYTLKSNETEIIHTFLNGTEQTNGGFSSTNYTTNANIASTYYVMECYSLLPNESIPNSNLHLNWTLFCRNNDGGFGGNNSLDSTLINTYFGVLILNKLGNLSSLVNVSSTVNYLKSFYIDIEGDIINYGGYLPDNTSKNTLISSTFYCVKALSIINSNELSNTSTIEWVLDRQNYRDGGFLDIKEEYREQYSSVTTTYYAFKTLKILDTELLSLDEEIFIPEFNWLILIIILASIGGILVLTIIIWRKRRI